MKKVVIFTDLDGTLLDAGTYSFEGAVPALALLKKRDIPLVFVSSKTAGEIMKYREMTDNHHPFVSENGGGVFFPRGYFRDIPRWYPVKERGDYYMLSLGTPYAELLDGLARLKEIFVDIKGFSDLSVGEVQQLTGLDDEEARLAKERDFDEPLVVGDGVDISALKRAILDLGFHYTSGRLLHLIGNNNKGRAVRVIKELFRRHYGRIVSVAIGDSMNDIPMLMNVDHAIAVRKPDGSHDVDILKEVPHVVPSDGIGPAGFNTSIMKIVEELDETA